MTKMMKSPWDIPSLFREALDYTPSGLTVYEDKSNVYVEAQVPGVDLEHISVEYTKEKHLVIHAEEKKEEEKEKKYYRKSQKVFSYALHVPGNVDPDKKPEAELKKGVLTVRFVKLPQEEKTHTISIKHVE